MSKPNFFIVGAPKSATTALNKYLHQHPDVFIPNVKELHYFGTDLDFLPPGQNFKTVPRSKEELEYYLSFFEGAEGASAIGEASVWYLYSKKAAEEIKAFASEAKIIITLRNPVDLLYSLHSQFLWEGNEDIVDFTSALAVEPDRKQGNRLPATMDFRKGLFYREVVRFSDQVKRYLDLFGPQNVLVLFYEDFSSDPESSFTTVLNFLGVSDTFIPEFRRVNANKKVRSKTLRNILKNPGSIVRLGGKIIPDSIRSKVIHYLRNVNTKYEERAALKPQIRSQLTQEFKPEIEKLQNILQRDLSFWFQEDS